MKKWLICFIAFEIGLTNTLTEQQLDDEIKLYKEKLQQNQIKPIQPYKHSPYIENRFQEESQSAPKQSPTQKLIAPLLGEETITKEQKAKLSQYYTLADKKKGMFFSVSLGGLGLTNAYSDGRYSRSNNVIDTSNEDAICSNSDKSGCSISGIFKSPNSGWYSGDGSNYSDNFLNVESSLFVFGGEIGYQSFFNPYFGSRIYGNGLFSTGEEKINGNKVGSLYYILGGINADLLFDLPLSLFIKHNFWKNFTLGTHFGVNIGVMLLWDSASEGIKQCLNDSYVSKNVLWQRQLQVDYGINVGFNIGFDEKNKLEFNARIPMSVFGLPSELRLGIEQTASYNGVELDTNDIVFTRTPIYLVSYIRLF